MTDMEKTSSQLKNDKTGEKQGRLKNLKMFKMVFRNKFYQQDRNSWRVYCQYCIRIHANGW